MKNTKTYLLALSLTLTFALPLQSFAQEKYYDQKSEAWWNQLEKQLSVSLETPIDQVRDETLQHIVFFASNYTDKIDLGHLTPTLLGMYENERNEARRTMAVVALRAIGQKSSMNRLARLAQEQPPGSLRNITMAVLADYRTSS